LVDALAELARERRALIEEIARLVAQSDREEPPETD
jgi:hypothetical protein